MMLAVQFLEYFPTAAMLGPSLEGLVDAIRHARPPSLASRRRQTSRTSVL